MHGESTRAIVIERDGRAVKPHCREISTEIARWIHRETETEWPINMY